MLRLTGSFECWTRGRTLGTLPVGMVRFASEDIGLADPQALPQADCGVGCLSTPWFT